MGRHTDAVNTTLAAAGSLDDEHLALIELVRSLAEQSDAAGPFGSGTRLAGTYLTALRSLNAVLATKSQQSPRSAQSLQAIRSRRKLRNTD